MSNPRLSSFGLLLAVLLLPNSVEAFDDVFALGFSLSEACDLEDDSPISDKCYGLVGAVAEIVIVNQTMQEDRRIGPRTCIPRGVKVPEIVAAIRPKLRSYYFCGGLCTSTGWVISALADAYPCKK